MCLASWRRGRRRSPASTPTTNGAGADRHYPQEFAVRGAVDRLQTRGADPRVRRRLDRRRRRRGVAQEALDGRDDGGRLLRRGGRARRSRASAGGWAPAWIMPARRYRGARCRPSSSPACAGSSISGRSSSRSSRAPCSWRRRRPAAPRRPARSTPAALAGMFGASALYHRVAWRPSLPPWFRRLDHSMIFVLIAGTSTPVIVLGLEGVLPVVVLAVVWVGALVGALLNLVWIGAPRRLVATVYVVLGWVGVVLLPETARHARDRPGAAVRRRRRAVHGGRGDLHAPAARPAPRRLRLPRDLPPVRDRRGARALRGDRGVRRPARSSGTRRRAPRPTPRTTAAGGR